MNDDEVCPCGCGYTRDEFIHEMSTTGPMSARNAGQLFDQALARFLTGTNPT